MADQGVLQTLVDKVAAMLTCPISLAILEQPVEIGDGYLYSRRSAEGLFELDGQERSPMTREQVHDKNIRRSQVGHDLLQLYADLLAAVTTRRAADHLAGERVAAIGPEVLDWLNKIPAHESPDQPVNASDEPQPDDWEEAVQASMATSRHEDARRQANMSLDDRNFDEAVTASLADAFKRRRVSDNNDRVHDFYSEHG